MATTTFTREFMKKEFPELIQLIQKTHEMGPEIENELYVNHTPVEHLCHQRSYFKIFMNPNIYMQYTMDHVIKNVELKLIGRAVQEVIIYDTFQEYEVARVKAMSAVAPQNQDGLNLN